jgi:hypothetical protein
VANNIIQHNYAYEGGGGMGFGYGSRGIAINNTVYGNLAINGGGGLLCYDSSDPILANCIFWCDSANSNPEIRVNNSSPIITYCDVQGGFEGQGNINADPSLRNPENDDFRLMAIACGNPYDSPCIDAGDPDILDSLLNCSWGLGTIRSDMGAYAGGDSAAVGIGQDTPTMPRRFSLFPNYPNPFNPTTTIEYDLPIVSDVTLVIFDILGRKVVTLVSGLQQPGRQRVVWNAAEYPSGIYFYRLKADDFVETKKMVLLK